MNSATLILYMPHVHYVETNVFPMGDIIGQFDLVKGHSDLAPMHADRPLVVHYK
jgi:hypothetical protein